VSGWQQERQITPEDRELVMRWSTSIIKWHELPTYGEIKRLVTLASMAIRVMDWIEVNRDGPSP
jgi:hypothetical protein